MKRGRVFYRGEIHRVTEVQAGVLLDNGAIVDETEVTWLPPVEAGTIFALGLNYADHAAELNFRAPKEPLVFLKGPNALCGHLGHTDRPSGVQEMHYECELAVVIGKQARNVPRDLAYGYVAGYTVANDYAFRDFLENYYRPNLQVKSRDASTPLGPWLVDASDVTDPMNLCLTTTVNGRLTQQGSTKDMIFSIPMLVEYLSGFMTLKPGDLILTGTPEGLANVGPGDVIVTEIESIGRLTNTIVEPTE